MDEEEARQAAEARRRRILEAADNRLGLVTGEVVAATTTTTHSSSQDDDGAALEDDTTASSATESKTKLSGSARLAAMRKRRFAKKKDGDATAGEAETPTEETVVVGEEDSTAVANNAEEPSETEPTETNISEESTTTKKKYMGVARMRRQKLKEQAAKDSNANATGGSSSSSTITSSDSVLSKDKVAAVMARKKRSVNLLPILLHMVTTILLFMAGLDAGLQQPNHSIAGAMIHRELAPRQLGLLLWRRSANAHQKLLGKWQSSFGGGGELVSSEDVVVEDEFATTEPLLDDAEHNIDPLFRVDLDKLTETDTIVNRLGRVAIYVHRLNLKFFYYYPKGVLSNMVNGFTQLFTIPPLLCLVALVTRQIVGKMLFGATLPNIKHVDESKIKSAVKAFVTQTFPTVYSLYDAWSHLRTDMYVVLCGLVVGLSIHYQMQSNLLEGSPADAFDYQDAAETMEPETTTGDEL